MKNVKIPISEKARSILRTIRDVHDNLNDYSQVIYYLAKLDVKTKENLKVLFE